VKLPTDLHLVPKLRMSGAVLTFLYAVMACIGKILPLFLHILVGLSIKENDMGWARDDSRDLGGEGDNIRTNLK